MAQAYRTVWIVLLTLLLGAPLYGQEEGGAKDEKKQQEEQDKKAAAQKAQQEQIREMFRATNIEFGDEGEITLSYNFTRKNESVAYDFEPTIESVPKYMRWSRGWEGYHTLWEYGVVVNRFGKWLHKGVWDEVSFEFEFGSLSEIMKKGEIIAAVYAWDKGKRFAGSNLGEQCVYLNSGLKHAKTPIPKKHPSLMQNGNKRTIGLKVSNGLLTATRNGRRTADSASKSSFLKKIRPGRVGIAWNGQWVKLLIVSVKIQGKLNQEWLDKALEEVQ